MVIYFKGQLGNFWCVIASVCANKLACDRLLVGAYEQKKGERAVIKQTIEKRREERREKLLKTTSLPGLFSAPTQFSRTFSRSCSAPLCWSQEQASKKWEDHHPDSSPGLLATKTPLKKVNSRCLKLQAFISSPHFFLSVYEFFWGRPFPIVLSDIWRLEQFFAVLATSSKFCLS